MPRNPESLKITPWALSGDRVDPENANPAVDRSVGFDSTYGSGGTNTPSRQLINQMFCELTSLADEINKGTYLEWSALVDYPQNAIVMAAGNLWRATVATGPGTSNATNPETALQTVWVRLTRVAAPPLAPARLTATAVGSSQVNLVWTIPDQRGAAITAFHVERRVGNGAWGNQVVIADPVTSTSLTGLAASTNYTFRVRGVNSAGNGAWVESTQVRTGTNITAPARPGSISVTTDDTQLSLSWSAVANGGRCCHLPGSVEVGGPRLLNVTAGVHYQSELYPRLADQWHRVHYPGQGDQLSREQRVVCRGHRNSCRADPRSGNSGTPERPCWKQADHALLERREQRRLYRHLRGRVEVGQPGLQHVTATLYKDSVVNRYGLDKWNGLHVSSQGDQLSREQRVVCRAQSCSPYRSAAGNRGSGDCHCRRRPASPVMGCRAAGRIWIQVPNPVEVGRSVLRIDKAGRDDRHFPHSDQIDEQHGVQRSGQGCQ